MGSVINLFSNWALIARGESVSYLSTLGSSGLGSSKFVLNVKGHANERLIRSVPLKQIYRWKPIRRRFCSKTWYIIKWSVCWGPCNHFLSLWISLELGYGTGHTAKLICECFLGVLVWCSLDRLFCFLRFFFLYTATVTLHNDNWRRFDSEISEETYNHGWTIESSNSLDASHTDAFSGAHLSFLP